VNVRQSLSGANYGLLDDDTLEPRPDYWNSLAWKRLMGPVVLAASVTDPKGLLRAYAHCTRTGAPGSAPGAVTLVALNLDRADAARVRVEGAAVAGAEAYVLTASLPGATQISLNGKELHAAADGTPPAFTSARISGDTLQLPALSYAFVVL